MSTQLHSNLLKAVPGFKEIKRRSIALNNWLREGCYRVSTERDWQSVFSLKSQWQTWAESQFLMMHAPECCGKISNCFGFLESQEETFNPFTSPCADLKTLLRLMKCSWDSYVHSLVSFWWWRIFCFITWTLNGFKHISRRHIRDISSKHFKS